MTRQATADTTKLAALSAAELLKLERQIARRHSGMFPWLIVIWAFGNITC